MNPRFPYSPSEYADHNPYELLQHLSGGDPFGPRPSYSSAARLPRERFNRRTPSFQQNGFASDPLNEAIPSRGQPPSEVRSRVPRSTMHTREQETRGRQSLRDAHNSLLISPNGRTENLGQAYPTPYNFEALSHISPSARSASHPPYANYPHYFTPFFPFPQGPNQPPTSSFGPSPPPVDSPLSHPTNEEESTCINPILRSVITLINRLADSLPDAACSSQLGRGIMRIRNILQELNGDHLSP